jgi:hypothetical protein
MPPLVDRGGGGGPAVGALAAPRPAQVTPHCLGVTSMPCRAGDTPECTGVGTPAHPVRSLQGRMARPSTIGSRPLGDSPTNPVPRRRSCHLPPTSPKPFTFSYTQGSSEDCDCQWRMSSNKYVHKQDSVPPLGILLLVWRSSDVSRYLQKLSPVDAAGAQYPPWSWRRPAAPATAQYSPVAPQT